MAQQLNEHLFLQKIGAGFCFSHGSSQVPGTPILGHWVPSGLCGIWTYMVHTNLHIHTYK